MPSPVAPEETSALSPDDAFAVLGDETRLQILQTLGAADDPLPFSDLFKRVDYETSANFSYHLDKLEGHFVRQTDDGYELGQAGTRVVQAVLAGTVTKAPELERTRIEHRCEFCEAPVEMSYSQGILGLYCTDCSSAVTDAWPPEYRGFIRGYPLPPAGLQGRTAKEVHRTAVVWGQLQEMLIAHGICPTCSASLRHTINACPNHQTDGDFCDACGRRWAVLLTNECTNCIVEAGMRLREYVLNDTAVVTFLATHGVNPLAPTTEPWVEVDVSEEVCSTDPFTARLTFSIDGDTLAVTVDEELSLEHVDSGDTTAQEH